MDEKLEDSYVLGFSAMALILSFSFSLAIFAVSLAIGLRRCTPGMPLNPTSTLVIAAACHPPEQDRYAARKPIKWGVISTAENTGQADSPRHCTITSRRLEFPSTGVSYT